ncbi:hypothetical protein ABIA35_002642 [Catenulispora sp. MAP12-49]|uniref:hypothetical protein n=1 Tax=Catenulispora sp. MAP12-49 TaxID=3156302 RepID=UPI0035143E32
MNDESEREGLQGGLHGAFDAAVSGLVIGSSPTAEVMRDGAVRRTRRRLAVTSGVAALAVLPVAAMGVFAGGHPAKGRVVSAASSPTSSPTSKAKDAANPPPIVVPTPLPAPGKGNPALPNDSVVVLASGTQDGQHWRLVRDHYVVAGPEPANVMGDPSSRPHLPYAANWDKPGTIECDFTAVQWGDAAPGEPGDFLAGGGCNPTDDGSITRILGRFAEGSPPQSNPVNTPAYTEGRIDGADAAYVTVHLDGWSSGKQPVIEVPGEQNDYFMVMVPGSALSYKNGDVTVYDAHGRVLGTQKYPGPMFGTSVPSPTAK